MLTALFIAWLLSGGSPELFVRDDFRAVESVIVEAERAAPAVKTMERMNDNLAELVETRQELLARLSEIDTDVDAPIASYNAVLDELWTARKQAADAYVDDVFRLRQSITRDEWNAIFSP